MNAEAVLRELQGMGSENYKRLLMKNYGVKEPFFGVKIGEMKKIQKRIGKDYQLALDLYETGNYDAMYLAGLIADDARMSRADLNRWVANAYAGSLPGATVAWVAAGSRHGWPVALEWIESPEPATATAGWSTLAHLVALKPDEELDRAALRQLVARVEREIQQAPDAVRYAMNGFIIAVGGYVKSLTDFAIQTGERIGPVMADLGNNACKIPFAPDHIRKMESRGVVGKKRKTVKC